MEYAPSRPGSTLKQGKLLEWPSGGYSLGAQRLVTDKGLVIDRY